MKFTISREQLLKPLQTVTSVVERRQTLPILSNLLLSSNNSQLSITGTDLEVEITSKLSVDVTKPGDITVPARKLFDICRALPENANIEFSLNESRVTIRSGKSRFVLSTLPAAEFPTIDALSATLQFTVNQSVLKQAIDLTHFAMAQQDVRYYLNGMLMEISDDGLLFVATDGHRLSLCNSGEQIDTQEHLQVIIPRKGILELSRLLDDGDTDIEVQLGSNFIRINTDNMNFTSKLIDGRFPDYQNVVPTNCNKKAVCDRETLRQALARVSILSNEKYRGVRMQFSSGLLKMSAHNPEQEEAEEEIAVDYSGDDLEIGFNVSYVLDAISVGSTDQVQIQLTDPNSCCLIQGVGEKKCKYVVMPMRL